MMVLDDIVVGPSTTRLIDRRLLRSPSSLSRWSAQSNPERFQAAHQGAAAVFQCRRVVQGDSIEPGQQPAERDLRLESGQRGPDAIVNTVTESKVRVRISGDIQPVGFI